ncbi:hypothetical protein BPAE_0164g00260 [Botrytis paeoniae]|uniref:Uncharacterized protein n=1 Tax=Botrytis paeoniae TaxID=278948 RepID=A0A4Z1FGU8_9HELO|nr:hypothetical protein BPAE_0164g00260 [Botrytis paeoniae]
MSDKHRVLINPQRKKTVYSINKADESLIESTKQQSQSATSRCEIMDTMNVTVVDTVQSSSRNDIIMKNHLGKRVRFSQKAMALYEDILGEWHFFDLPEADNDDGLLNLPKESPIILPEDSIEEDEEVPMIYKEIQPSDNTSLFLVQSPTIDSPGMPSQYYQNHSTYATMPPSFDTISNTIGQLAILERSSALAFSFLSDKDNRHECKHREDLSYSMMAPRPSSRRRDKNSIDMIIEEHNKKHAGKLGVTQANSKPLAPKVIQKKPTKRKGHKYSGSLEGFMVECQDQCSGSSLSGIYQEYQVDHDAPTPSWMFEEEYSFQQLGQAQKVPQSVDSIQHMGQMGRIHPNSTSFQNMGQGMIRPFMHEVQQFNYHCQSLPSPQRIDTQQLNYSSQQIGHTYYDWGLYPFNYISVLDEPHSPLFLERNLWAPRAAETLSNQSHYPFQMPAARIQGFETQQYTTARNGNCAAASPSSLYESFGSERGSGQFSESPTSPSLSPYQLQTAYTHRLKTM